MILPLMAYLFILFCLSFYSVRNQKSEHFLNQYFIGNRSMGGFVLAMTLSGTYISASSFIGGPGAAYQYGLGFTRHDPAPCNMAFFGHIRQKICYFGAELQRCHFKRHAVCPL